MFTTLFKQAQAIEGDFHQQLKCLTTQHLINLPIKQPCNSLPCLPVLGYQANIRPVCWMCCVLWGLSWEGVTSSRFIIQIMSALCKASKATACSKCAIYQVPKPPYLSQAFIYHWQQDVFSSFQCQH